MDEKLDEVDRFLHLLTNGSPVQKQFVLENISKPFEDSKEKAVKKILPFITVHVFGYLMHSGIFMERE